MGEPRNLPKDLPESNLVELPAAAKPRKRPHSRISHVLALRFLSREERKLLKGQRARPELKRRSA